CRGGSRGLLGTGRGARMRRSGDMDVGWERRTVRCAVLPPRAGQWRGAERRSLHSLVTVAVERLCEPSDAGYTHPAAWGALSRISESVASRLYGSVCVCGSGRIAVDGEREG